MFVFDSGDIGKMIIMFDESEKDKTMSGKVEAKMGVDVSRVHSPTDLIHSTHFMASSARTIISRACSR